MRSGTAFSCRPSWEPRQENHQGNHLWRLYPILPRRHGLDACCTAQMVNTLGTGMGNCPGRQEAVPSAPKRMGMMRFRATTLVLLTGLCGVAPAFAATQGPYLAGLRRLTETQYRNAI